MKNYQFFVLISVCLLALFSCNTDSNIVSTNDDKLEKSITIDEISDEQLYNKLDNIAQKLASMRVRLAKMLGKQKFKKEKRMATFSSLADKFEKYFIARGGHKFHITLDFAEHSPLEKIATDLRVAVDPDDYPDEYEGQALVYYVDDNGNLTSELIDAETYRRTQPFPLLLVNTDEELPESKKQTLGKTNASQGQYLTYNWIKIRIDHDPWAKDEFEMYFRTPDNYVEAETDLIFDGGRHEDAAGRVKYLPDLNGKGSNTYKDGSFALALLPWDYSQKVGLHAVEDDYNKGEIRFNYSSCYYPTYMVTLNVTTWNEQAGTKDYNENVLFRCNYTSWPDQDDVYWRGGFYGFDNTFPIYDVRRNSHNVELQLKRETL